MRIHPRPPRRRAGTALLLFFGRTAAGQVPEAPAPAPLLEPVDEALLAEALRWAGVERSDLLGGRESTNLGLPAPVDRWRLRSAEAALQDPLWLPELVARRRALLGADLALPVAPWDGLRAAAVDEFGPPPAKGACPAPLQAGLIQRVMDGPRPPVRMARTVRAELEGEVDRVGGALLAALARARCEARQALSPLDAATRTWLVEELDRGLLSDEDGDEQERALRAARLATAWEQVDRAALIAAGLAWSDAVRTGARDLAAVPVEDWPAGPLVLQTELGEVWVGSPDRDSLEGDPVLLLDPGGGDHWRIGLEERLTDRRPPPVRGWIDLGGDDLWTGGAAGPGGALLGLVAGVDLAGDDTMRTGPLSQGAAWFGVGTWLDAEGADLRSGPAGVQGFAGHGVGALRDTGEGDDLSQAGAWAQAAAWTGGLALLHDGAGDDRYVLGGRFEDSGNRLPGHFLAFGQGFATGARPWLGGGVAWLQDEAGHDQYLGGLYAQGSSYWHSLGVLVDVEGNDSYQADQYSQGAGIHLSAAGLFDLAGDDRYHNRYLGQGSGHDLSVSWLYEGAGNDVYLGQDSAQGAALTNAVSLFYDRAGDDLYAAASPQRHGYAGAARRYGSVALFVDHAGRDTFLEGAGAAGAPTGRPEGGEARALGPPPSTPEEAQALLLENCRWLAPYADTQAAVRRVVEAGPQAVAWVLPLASLEMHLRSHTVQAVIEAWAASPDLEGRRRIARDLRLAALEPQRSAEDGSVRWILRWLGLMALPAGTPPDPEIRVEAVAAVDQLWEHPAWAVRQAAWDLAADLAAAGQVPPLMRRDWVERGLAALAQEPVAEVQAAAGRFLGASGDGAAVAGLVELLRRGGLERRAAAEGGLVALASRGNGTLVLRAIRPLAQGPSGVLRDAALRIAGATGLEAALELLRPALSDPDLATRRSAALGLAGVPGPAARRLRARALDQEPDPRIAALLQPPPPP